MTKQTSTAGYIAKLVLILFLITAIVALLLGGVNAITKDKIAKINQEKTAEAIRTVLSSQAEPETLADYADETGLVKAVYRMAEDGWAVEIVVGGSQGDIDMMVGINADGTVSGISFVSMSETSGLGAVAAQSSQKGASFRSQFVGKSGELAVNKDGGEIDALTGATITSRAVTTGVNAALTCVAALG
ncbi:MAG: RnfABCDGE type electron transport complex subunit G [Oscillospiraceae bacterium]|nr:RnfABCDGE type electron transport complex subunit G [Oscillospiraceae bacterium]